MNAALLRLFLASLLRRRLATALSLLAIALGVALGLAVQLIHSAALEEFGHDLRLLAGEADLQVLGPRGGFDAALYATLAQRPEVAQAAPLLEIEAHLPGRGAPLRLLGIDVFRAAQLYPRLVPVAAAEALPAGAPDRLAALRPDNVFLSPAARVALGLDPGDRLVVQAGLGERALHVAGVVPGAGVGQRLAVMDIAALQRLFGRIGVLTRIDLRLAPGVSRAQAQVRLRALLPAGVELLAPEAGAVQTAALTRAYRVNLTMLAAIALLTGGFLVFSTQVLAVVRRRQEFAFLRALGMDRATLFRGLLAEGAVIGLLGGALGVALAYALSAVAFALLGGDLGAGYFQAVTPRLRLQPGASLVYLLLGAVAGVAGAWLPGREALRSVPARALHAGAEEDVLQARGGWRAALVCFGAALLLCLPPPLWGVPVFGYAAVVLILAGALLLLPGAARLATRVVPAGRGPASRLAHARLAAAPGQAVVAGAGILVSVALVAAMAIMVSSFRSSVDDWLARMLSADLYVRTTTDSGLLNAATVARVAALPGVAAVEPRRFDRLRLAAGHPPVTLIARPVGAATGLPLVTAAPATPPGRSGGLPPAWISEALADLLDLRVGATLELPLAGRLQVFRIAGIWRDYARQNGAVIVELSDYRAASGDTRSDDLAIELAAGARADTVMTALHALLGEQVIEIETPGTIRATSLAIFDRTFLITYVMEAVAVLIGLFGIATSFAALATSRRKEFGMLRHLGVLRREIGTLLGIEGALTAVIGVTVGMAAGGAIALVLIEVINRQSFHWSMDLHLPAGRLLAFALALVVLAALAARLAGRQALRQDAVLAVREDW
ncbi:MAG: FtsX-like permease family protein [Thiohalobacteraceae bacterium]